MKYNLTYDTFSDIQNDNCRGPSIRYYGRTGLKHRVFWLKQIKWKVSEEIYNQIGQLHGS